MAARGLSVHYKNAYIYCLLEELNIPTTDTEDLRRLKAYYNATLKLEKQEMKKHCKEAAMLIMAVLPMDSLTSSLSSNIRGIKGSKSFFDITIRHQDSDIMGIQLQLQKSTIRSIRSFQMRLHSFFNLLLNHVYDHDKQTKYATEWNRIQGIIDTHDAKWERFDYVNEVIIPIESLMYQLMSDLHARDKDTLMLLYDYYFNSINLAIITFTDKLQTIQYFDMSNYYSNGNWSLRRSPSGGIIEARGNCQVKLRIIPVLSKENANYLKVAIAFKTDDVL